jgi:hypothetical protein
MHPVSVVQLKPDFEEVFTVTDYYDGPRKGIANVRGKPHFATASSTMRVKATPTAIG